MRKNIIKIGTMALTASMMLTPASNVFAARESQKTVEVVDSTNHDEQSGGNAESEIEAQGILTTAYIVTADVLNVRSGPGTTYSKIGTLAKGQTVYVYNGTFSGGWARIKFAGSSGYVSAQYIAKK